MGILWGAAYGHQAARTAAEGAAGKARRQAEAAIRNRETLEDRLDKLTIVCMAMWELLKEVSDLTEEHLLERVKQLDLRDGTADGKITKTVAKCPKCNRVMNPRHRKCLYCGAAKLNVGAFDHTL